MIDATKVTQKVWGWSELQVESNLCQVHRIDIRPGGFCSIHQHDRKHNVFTLVKGKLHIRLWDENVDLGVEAMRTIVLASPGDTYDVGPAIVHQFYAPEYCMAIETYYPASVRTEDIFRFSDLGGVDP